MVNLVANLLGQIAAIDDEGRLAQLTVAQVLERVGEVGVSEMVSRVFEVGQAVRAYGPSETVQGMTTATMENLRTHGTHVPSSIQWLGLRMARGESSRGLTPTEAWLLDPLIHYARSAGLVDAERYFIGLRTTLEAKLQ